MTLGGYYLAGLVFTAISILGVGASITAWLRRFKLVEVNSASGLLLMATAAGIYWNMIVFLLVFFGHLQISYSVTLAKFAVELAIVAITVLFSWPQARDLVHTVSADGLTLLLGLSGALLGSWAMMQFPQVLDSGQLIWTQLQIANPGNLPVSAMMGYTGLVIFVAAIFPGTPVVVMAASLKPLLFGIFGCVAVYAADCINPKRRKFYAAAFFALALLSFFGSYGLVQLGKDSVWGILFALAFMTTLCREDADRHNVEAALYFAVASTTGVIAVPYIVMFYALWLALACPPKNLGRSLAAMALINLPSFPTVLAGFGAVRPLFVFALYVPAALLVVMAHRRNLFRWIDSIDQRPFRMIAAFLPLLLLVVCAALFPIRLKLAAWSNPDGTTIFDVRPPLDGKTNFYEYFIDVPLQQFTVICGLAAALFIGWTPLGKRQSGFIALAVFPLAVLSLALIRVHTGIPIINDFNMWDMIRDIPNWLGGTVFVFLALAGAEAIAELSIIPAAVGFGGPVLMAVICAYAGQREISTSTFFSPVHYSRYAGYVDADMADTSSLVWEKFRGFTLWMDPALNISKSYFYSFQMYGAAPAEFSIAKIGYILRGTGPKLLIVQNKDLNALIQQANEHGKALHYLDILKNDAASMILIQTGGPSDASHVSGVVRPASGSYETEKVGDIEFHWMQADAGVSAVIPGSSVACVTLSLFDAGLSHGPQIVHLAEGGNAKASVDITGHSPQDPALLRATISLRDGDAELVLHADAGNHNFPRDSRKISYGLLEPIDVVSGQACSP